MARIVTGLEIQRGKTSKNRFGDIPILDFQPIHLCSESEKNKEWKEHVADFYEHIGWTQVRRNYKKLMKNRKLVAGELDMEDYIVNPEENEFSGLVGIIQKEETIDPLKQYYGIIPNVIGTLVGESLQQDNRVIVKAVDEFSTDERLLYKEELFRETLIRQNMADRQASLLRMGFVPDENNEQAMQYYQQEMETAKSLAEVEASFKKFRTQAEIWGQHKIEINRKKFNLEILEKEAFQESLTNSRVAFNIDLGEDDFKVTFLDNSMCFYHKSKNLNYYSEGDYFGWFEYVTVGDIINSIGSRPDVDDKIIEKLKETLELFRGMLLPDHLSTSQGTYYDTSKRWPEGYMNIPMVQAHTDIALRASLGTGEGPASFVLKENGKTQFGDPRLFRMMRLYVKSQRKIGWLTKVNRLGQVEYQDWVDENFKVTVEPTYDNSITKAKTKENLLYGEHVDWEWTNQWRHFIKVTNNIDHSFWRRQDMHFDPIYLDGDPCKFQFKGKENPNDIFPPFEGCEFRTQGMKPISLADRMKPWQIIANIAGNKVPAIMAKDPGVVLAMDRQTIPRDYMSNESSGDPVEAYFNTVIDRGIIDRSISKEQLEGNGANIISPSRVDLSRVKEIAEYMGIFRAAKEEALEAVGITRARLGQQKPYETAGGIEAGIQFSETVTLKYFHQFFQDFMPRLYQRILEATQYYSSQSEYARIDYMNSKEDNVFLEVTGGELIRDLHVYASASPHLKKIETQLKQLLLSDNTMGMGILEKAEGFVAETVSDYMQKLRKWNFEQQEKERAQFEEQQETMRYQAELQVQNAREQRENDNLQKQLDRESKERIAVAQSLGRIQSPEVVNSLDTASQILQDSLKEQEMGSKIQSDRRKQDFEEQKHIDETLLRQQEIAAKLEEKQIDYKIAKENKTASELSKKSK